MKKIISKNSAGIRIDKFLKQEVFLNWETTRGEIIRQIKKGNILVNNKKIKPSYILKEKDRIDINIPEKNTKLEPNRKVKFGIIYQDKNIIVVNKPAGLQAHPSFKNENDTLVNGLLDKFPEIKNVGDVPRIRPGIVHRLDRETSGLMVIARNQKSFLELKDQFKNKKIKKVYATLVCGQMKEKEGMIEKPIARSADYKKQVIAGKKTKTKIRPALTFYKVINESRGFTLLEVTPKTGRTHQIRVHLASIGYPVFGDAKYGKKNKRTDIPTRHYLHAKKLEFELFGKLYKFESPVPEEFARPLDEKRI